MSMNILNQPKLVIIESPFRATPFYSEEQHRLYLHHCIDFCIRKGESPYASHLYLTTFLDDEDQAERAWGLKCGWEWGQHADLIAVFSDFGVSPGMAESIERYSKFGKTIEWRKLPDKIVASIKQLEFGEFNKEEPPDDKNYCSGCDVFFSDIACHICGARA